VDYRLFDVALALVYFTSVWDDQATELRPDKFTLFLSAYNKACLRLSRINPLSKQERSHLIPMLSIANLYVLNWDLVDFYDTPNQDDDEYYSYIHHNISLVRWIARHIDKLKGWVNKS
jgi:hypothetical protein